MDIQSLERSLKSSGPRPVYVIRGEDPFLRQEALALIKRAASRDGDCDVREVDAEGLDVRELLDALHTPGLFAERRLVILDHADKIFPAGAETLLGYLRRPAANATLVLMAESLDARRKGVKAVLQKAACVECRQIRAGRVAAWCMARAQRHGKRLRPEAARLLVESAGNNLGRLDGHLAALAAYCGDRPTIEPEDVAALVGGDRTWAVWEIAQATIDRAPLRALRAVHRLKLEPRSSPTWVVASLGRRLRDLWRTRELLDAGHPPEEVQHILDKEAWEFRTILRDARRFQEGALREACRRVLEADLECKTMGRTDWVVVERLILELCEVAGPEGSETAGRAGP